MDNLDRKAIWPGWETVRLIGRGSYGAVYEIRRTIAGEEERAAVKCLSIPMDESEIKELRISCHDEESIARRFSEEKDRFIREYSTMARLKGVSHIVYCDDIRTEPHADGIGWDIFIKMELLTPLTTLLQGPMEEKNILRLGKDIAKALSSCHNENIIHRDVKPQNIFVNREGEFKLGDFGVARSMEGTGSASVRTGTFRYMAPEVFNGEPYGPKADICSLGLVLYWLLNERRLPFLSPDLKLPTPDEEKQSYLRRFRGEPLPPPATGSEAFKRVVLRACAYNPRDRFLTAEEMLEALEKLSAPRQRLERPIEEQGGQKRPENFRRQENFHRPEDPGPIERRRDAKAQSVALSRQRPQEKRDKSRQTPFLLAAIGAFAVLLTVLLILVLRGGRTDERVDPIPATEPPAPTEESALISEAPAEAVPETQDSREPESPATPEPTPEPTAEPTPEIPQYTRQQVVDNAKRAEETIEGYSYSSNTGASLVVPEEREFLREPFQMVTKSSRGEKGTIYIMPRPDSNTGHLGQLPHGVTVTILAEQNGYYFFVTQDGRAGWNGKKFFSEP